MFSLFFYSLTDLIWLTAFSSFPPQEVRFCLPNLACLLGALPRVCINILFVSTPQNVYFAHMVETKSMFIHTRGSAPKRSAKFGRQKRTFCGKKEEKAVSQIKSDRL